MATIKKQRNANMDLLRIVSMLLIILLHSIDHSGVIEATITAPITAQLWVRFTYMLTQVCVNCYVLISGYFLVSSRFRLQKLIVLWMEVVFYSLTIRVVFILAGYRTFSITSILSCFVPVFTGRYWFITIYFGLYLLFPFLNIAIKAMNKRQHTVLNILLFVLFSVMVSIHPSFAGMKSGGGWGLAWFVVLYFAAAWFRLYYDKTSKLLPVLIYIGGAVFIACGYVFVGSKITIVRTFLDNLYRYDSVAAYVFSLCVLSFFINVKINSRIVNSIIVFIAPATFGVYLIHAHADFSPWSWEFLNMPQYLSGAAFPIIQIGIVIAIFAFCTILDLMRKYTIGRIESSSFIRRISDSITGFVKKFIMAL